MADNIRIKASKYLDNARVAVHTILDDISVAAYNTPGILRRMCRK
jgi:hypothetical protein